MEYLVVCAGNETYFDTYEEAKEFAKGRSQHVIAYALVNGEWLSFMELNMDKRRKA